MAGSWEAPLQQGCAVGRCASGIYSIAFHSMHMERRGQLRPAGWLAVIHVQPAAATDYNLSAELGLENTYLQSYACIQVIDCASLLYSAKHSVGLTTPTSAAADDNLGWPQQPCQLMPQQSSSATASSWQHIYCVDCACELHRIPLQQDIEPQMLQTSCPDPGISGPLCANGPVICAARRCGQHWS